MTETINTDVDNRIIKLDLIRLVYNNCGSVAEALREAKELYDFIMSDNSMTSED